MIVVNGAFRVGTAGFSAGAGRSLTARSSASAADLALHVAHGGGDTKASWLEGMRLRKTRYRKWSKDQKLSGFVAAVALVVIVLIVVVRAL